MQHLSSPLQRFSAVSCAGFFLQQARGPVFFRPSPWQKTGTSVSDAPCRLDGGITPPSVFYTLLDSGTQSTSAAALPKPSIRELSKLAPRSRSLWRAISSSVGAAAALAARRAMPSGVQ